MNPTPDYHDFSIAGFLDQLAAGYESRGYRVGYLPFVYSVDFIPLLSLATDRRTMTIEADADFIGHSWAYTSFLASGGAILLPRVLVQITLDNNQRRLLNTPTMIGNIFGSGPAPGQMFKPLVLPAKSTLTFELQSLAGGGNDMNLRLSLCGVKAFLTNL